jgi:hypothetical protein
MQTLIEALAGSPRVAQRLQEDPLREACAAGYVVSYDDVRVFLDISLRPGKDVRSVLCVHLARFDLGKWYQAA